MENSYSDLEFGTPLATFNGVSAYRELVFPDPDWLVDELVIERGHHVLYGQTGSKKSFVAMDLALRLVNGMDFHGRSTTPCEVLYVVGEDAPEFKKRQEAWLHFHGKKKQLVSVPYPVQFKDAHDSQSAFDGLIGLVRWCQARLVIFDTLSDMTEGVKLSDPDEFNAYVKPHRKRLTALTGAATLYVHHEGHKEGTERGARMIRDETNLAWRVGVAGKLTKLHIGKLRGSSSDQPDLYFKPVQSLSSLVLIEVPKASKSGDVTTGEDNAPRRQGRKRITAQDKIERALSEGSSDGMTAEAIAEVTEILIKTVKNTLTAMKRNGLVRNTEPLWRLVQEE